MMSLDDPGSGKVRLSKARSSHHGWNDSRVPLGICQSCERPV
ncbi:Hypothetical protein A7982_06747 [Minicystis rosea]|nr:Hypothetical protein A7982_06747 [Minicystis rosea]